MSAAGQAPITDLDRNLLRALSQRGPQFSADLAARFGLNTRAVSIRMVGLRRQGLVSQEARRYNRRGHTKLLWAILPGVDWAFSEEPLPPMPGITTEDLAWQAYWRLPRAVRRTQEAPPHAV